MKLGTTLEYAVIFILLSVVVGQNPCNTNNGGCDTHCIWTGSGPRTCACDCGYVLGEDGSSCSPLVCDVDVYVGIDNGAIFCDLTSIGFEPFFGMTQPDRLTQFRQNVVTFLQSTFASKDQNRFRFGIQLLFRGSGFYVEGNNPATPGVDFQNFLRFDENNLDATLTDFLQLPDDYCVDFPEGLISYFQHWVRQNSILPPNYVRIAPGPYRNEATTTRIALLFVSGFSQSVGNNDLNILGTATREFFDESFVVNAFDTTISQFIETPQQRKMIGCGDPNAVCEYNFNFDGVNEAGEEFNTTTFENLVNYQACVVNLNASAAEPTCGAVPLLEIPKCRLNGLTIDQLQFLDPSCDINDFIIDETVTSYILSINPNLCQAFVGSTSFRQTVEPRLFHENQTLPSVSFTINCTLFTEFSPCGEDNGGCSHGCIWSSGNPHFCVCPCGMKLDERGYDCVDAFPCDVDLYVGIDIGLPTSLDACNNIPTTEFEEYRDFTINFLQNFVELSEGPLWNIGVQTYSVETRVTDFKVFQTSDLETAIANLSNVAMPDCDFLSTDYVNILARAVPSNPNILGFQSLVPGELRNRANTTAIAVAFTSGAYSNANPLTIINSAYEYYDYLIVVTQRVFEDTLERNRMIACNNQPASEPCPQSFAIFEPNLGGQMFDIDNFFAPLDLNSCNLRRDVVPRSIVTCSPRITVFIPTCELLGVDLETQMQFFDPDCSLSDAIISQSEEGFMLSISSFECGIKSEIVGNNVVLTQKVFVRGDTGLILPNVNVTIECTYPLPAPPESPTFNDAIADSSSSSNDVVNFYASLNPSFEPPLEADATVVVNCLLYFKIETSIASPFSVLLDSCHATTTSNPFSSTRYDIVINGCPFDDSFVLLQPESNGSVCFLLNMFEWSSTFHDVEANKLPVFIHCNLKTCAPTAPCDDPFCDDFPNRRRRSADEKEVATFGPLYVSRPGEDEKAKDEKTANKNVEQKETIYIIEQTAAGDENSNEFYQRLVLIFLAVMAAFFIWKMLNNARSAGRVFIEKNIAREKQSPM